ncbi:TonB-dependent siderophore receptor [Nitratiruptor sp. YY09-18]|uniref:TonB-dependent receptor plug domain-containing protein n=1 Tax=Nitratiruptor sp. YY09-18 TaxID=2724901 RepID=UPI0019154198|nr:TonB-dependent receptor [Nitratiruptor sp. YY09-18]BCD67917.1 iron complex outermembrane recepter protein [Nitratiruptor sp. YY09-18]
MVRRLVVSLLATCTLFGADHTQSLFDELQTFSNLAKETKETEFYQPHIISVYKGKDLEKVGAQNLMQALWLVPGLDIYGDNLDIKTAIFRGSNPFAYGQSKLFIDGVLVNDVMFDSYSTFLDMPIELIKRIEVIRGPGSKAEGYNAYAGSIYVITYAEDDDGGKVFAKRGSFRYRSIGFYKKWKIDDFHLYTEGYWQKDHKALKAGPDSLATGVWGADNIALAKSGKVPLWLDNYSFALYGDYKEIHFKLRTNRHKKGAAYGLSFMLPQRDDFIYTPSLIGEINYKKSLGKYNLALQIGRKYDSFKNDLDVAPPGFTYHVGGQEVVFADGFHGLYEAKQRTDYAKVEYAYIPSSRMTLKSGLLLTKEKTYKVKTITNSLDGSGAVVDYSVIRPFLNPHAKRVRQIYYLSADFMIDSQWSLYTGINYEKIIGKYDVVNPRLCVVYWIDDENILKFLASRSNRDPSWQEMFTINNTTRVGNPNLDPERVTAFEINYIKKLSTDDFFQGTIFYLKNSDVISNINPQREFHNSCKNSIYGLELELRKNITNSLQLYANYSYVYGKDDHSHPIDNVANHMAKIYLLKNIDVHLDMSIMSRYIGAKRRVYYDNRPKLNDYIDTDIAMRYKYDQNLEFSFVVKNIFDNDMRFPSKPYTYEKDYPITDGRTFMIVLRGTF